MSQGFPVENQVIIQGFFSTNISQSTVLTEKRSYKNVYSFNILFVPESVTVLSITEMHSLFLLFWKENVFSSGWSYFSLDFCVFDVDSIFSQAFQKVVSL